MLRYVRFEKKTSRGVLSHDVALDGVVLRQRSRRGDGSKTGRVGGGLQRGTSTFGSEVAARAALERRVKELVAEGFVRVSGPEIASPSAAPVKKKRAPRTFACTGQARPVAESVLRAFEAARGVRLPTDYRRFVGKRGAGVLLGFVRIHVPGHRGRLRLERLAGRAPHDLLAFADTGGGDLFLWRLPAPSVLYLEHGARAPRRVAKDFDALLAGLTTSRRFVDRLFPGLDPDPTFEAK